MTKVNPTFPARESLLAILSRFSEQQIVIVGDSIADKFLYGSISRVSREAPVFILKHELTETVPGGAANCAINLASLGSSVSLVSLVGDDETGSELRRKLTEGGVNIKAIAVSQGYETTTKVRILAGQTHSSRQQVIRIDYESEKTPDSDIRATLIAHLDGLLDAATAVIISDYNYGLVDEEVLAVVKKKTRERKLPVLVDSRFSLTNFQGVTAATPNEDEVEHLSGESIATTTQLESAASKLKQQLHYEALLVTRGPYGMMLLEGDESPLHINAVGAQQAVDVTGAGDTVIATFALSLASGASFAEAAHLANFAGGLVVMKRGTASITATELHHSIASFEGF